MGKKAEKKLKEAEEKKKEKKFFVRSSIIFYLIAVVLVTSGIIGLNINGSIDDEYKNSEDIRDVEATATYVEIKSEDDPDDYYNDPPKQRDYWIAKLTYTVDGKEYKTKKRFDEKIEAGDTAPIEVYKKADGSYRMSRGVVDSELTQIILYALIAAGGVAFVFGSAGVFIIATKRV